jgi:hypothetical protein
MRQAPCNASLPGWLNHQLLATWESCVQCICGPALSPTVPGNWGALQALRSMREPCTAYAAWAHGCVPQTLVHTYSRNTCSIYTPRRACPDARAAATEQRVPRIRTRGGGSSGITLSRLMPHWQGFV